MWGDIYMSSILEMVELGLVDTENVYEKTVKSLLDDSVLYRVTVKKAGKLYIVDDGENTEVFRNLDAAKKRADELYNSKSIYFWEKELPKLNLKEAEEYWDESGNVAEMGPYKFIIESRHGKILLNRKHPYIVKLPCGHVVRLSVIKMLVCGDTFYEGKRYRKITVPYKNSFWLNCPCGKNYYVTLRIEDSEERKKQREYAKKKLQKIGKEVKKLKNEIRELEKKLEERRKEYRKLKSMIDSLREYL